ncbi:unnamed protein product [Protopolystoma xenopodis]|uniref:Uncharacterized protein n=1 Tax=Protopolystoma xenopodis TaxID=117903 RepID=A0A448XKY1_9PLAT|nr:unnamed protein product [Protopolystoma xenopodis]
MTPRSDDVGHPNGRHGIENTDVVYASVFGTRAERDRLREQQQQMTNTGPQADQVGPVGAAARQPRDSGQESADKRRTVTVQDGGE